MDRQTLFSVFSKVLGGHAEDFNEFAQAYDEINKALVKAKRSERDLVVEVLEEMMESNDIDSRDGKLYIDFIDALNKRKATRAPEVHFKKRLSSDVITFDDEPLLSLWIIYLDRVKALETISANKLRFMDKAVAAAKLFSLVTIYSNGNQRHLFNSYFISSLDQLNQQILDSQDNASEFKKIIEQHADTIISLELNAAQQEEELSKKDIEIEGLNNTVEQNKNTIVNLQKELDRLAGDLSKVTADNNNLNQVLASQSDSLNDAESTIEQLNLEIRDKDQIISDMKDKVTELEELISSIKNKLEEKEKFVEYFDDANSKNKDLSDLLEKFKKEVQDKDEELSILKETHGSFIENSNQNNQILEDSVHDMQNLISKKDEAIAQNEEKIAGLEELLEKLKKDLQDKDLAYISLNETHNSLKEKSSKSNEDFEKTNSDKDETIAHNQENISKLEELIDSLKNELSEKQKFISYFDDASKSITDLEELIKQLKKEVQDKDDALSCLQETHESFKQESSQSNKALESSISDLTLSNSEKDQAIAQAQAKITELENIIDSMTNNLSEKEKFVDHFDDASKKISDLEKLIEKLKNDLLYKDKALTCLDETHNSYLDKVRINNFDLENTIQELQRLNLEKDETIAQLIKDHNQKILNLESLLESSNKSLEAKCEEALNLEAKYNKTCQNNEETVKQLGQKLQHLKGKHSEAKVKPLISEEVLVKVQGQAKEHSDLIEDMIEGEFTFTFSGKNNKTITPKRRDHDHNEGLVWECELKQLYLKSELEEKEKLIKKLEDDIKIKDEVLKANPDYYSDTSCDHSMSLRVLELHIQHLNSELETKDDIITLLQHQCYDYNLTKSSNDDSEMDLEELLKLQTEYRNQIESYSLQVEGYEQNIESLKKEIIEKGEFCSKAQQDYREQISNIDQQIKRYESQLTSLYMHNEYSQSSSSQNPSLLYENIQDLTGYSKRIQFLNKDIFLRTQILHKVYKSNGFESKPTERSSMEGYIPIPINLEAITYLEGHISEVTCIHSSMNGKYVVTGSTDKTIRLWDVTQLAQVEVFEGLLERVTAVIVTSNSKYVVSGASDGKIKVWNTKQHKEEVDLTDSKNPVLCLMVSKDDSFIVSGHAQGFIQVWSLSKKCLIGSLEGHSDDLLCLAITPDDKFVLSGSADHSIRVWNLEGLCQESVFERTSSVTSLVVTHDGKYAVAGYSDRTIHVWDIAEGKEEYELVAHTDSILSLFASVCGKFIVSASKDNTIRVWNTKDKKQAVVLNEKNYNISHIAAIRGGKSIAFATDTGKVGIWSQDLSMF